MSGQGGVSETRRLEETSLPWAPLVSSGVGWRQFAASRCLEESGALLSDGELFTLPRDAKPLSRGVSGSSRPVSGADDWVAASGTIISPRGEASLLTSREGCSDTWLRTEGGCSASLEASRLELDEV